jgi:hypothetical protein
MPLALSLLADAGRGAQDPGGGWSALLIVVTVVGIILALSLIFFAFHRLTRASRGGVEPRRGEFRRGRPPFESFWRRT